MQHVINNNDQTCVTTNRNCFLVDNMHVPNVKLLLAIGKHALLAETIAVKDLKLEANYKFIISIDNNLTA